MQLSINFGHELVTSVHTPIAWSDKRPTDEEFRTSFGATRLSSQRLLQFVRRRAHCIRRLVLQNSEGYWCGESRHRAACAQPVTGMTGQGLMLYLCIPGDVVLRLQLSVSKLNP